MRFCSSLFLILFLAGSVWAQTIPARVYAWSEAPVVRHAGQEERVLVRGSTRDFSSFAVRGITQSGSQSTAIDQRTDDETLVIVKEGSLTLTQGGQTKTLGPGSVALIIPGDAYQLTNQTSQPLTYYLMQYRARQLPTVVTSQEPVRSFWVDWNEVPFQPHDKGGIRRMFDRKTVMANRFEMHVTTLNTGLWSHPPHTHRAAEILLPIDNSAQESIDGVLQPAGIGDIIFLESNVPHAIQNTSSGSCTYFAFQFE